MLTTTYHELPSTRAVTRASSNGATCILESSRIEGVVFGANVNRNIVYWNSSVINVSSAGPATTIIPNMTALMHNQTLLPGAPPPKLSFSLQDAGGNPANVLASIAIRVRVIPRAVPSSAGQQRLY
jgi:hypothetical protein